MKTYAYVKKQCCLSFSAEMPGSFVGRNEEPVSRHGDYERWHHGKRQTLLIASTPAKDSNELYRQHCAQAVVELLGWN